MSRRAYARKCEEVDRLRASLKALYTLIKEGEFIRDISKDAEEDWPIRMMRLTKALSDAQQLLEARGVE